MRAPLAQNGGKVKDSHTDLFVVPGNRRGALLKVVMTTQETETNARFREVAVEICRHLSTKCEAGLLRQSSGTVIVF